MISAPDLLGALEHMFASKSNGRRQLLDLEPAVRRNLAWVPESRVPRFRVFSKSPTERDWERSVVLESRPAPRQPDLVSDGGGLPFALSALDAPGGRLDPEEPAVGALIAQLSRQKGRASESAPSLQGWRLLARTDEEALFGRGRPPELLTVAARRDPRRGRWTCVAVSDRKPLRATRDGVRASRWRLDPTRQPEPEATILRVLVTEQTFAGGKRADGRLLEPDLYVDDDELVLRMFVKPRPGFQARSPNPETLARIALPGPFGGRRLVDGALYAASDG